MSYLGWGMLIGAAILLSIIAVAMWDEHQYQKERIAQQRKNFDLATEKWKASQGSSPQAADPLDPVEELASN